MRVGTSKSNSVEMEGSLDCFCFCCVGIARRYADLDFLIWANNSIFYIAFLHLIKTLKNVCCRHKHLDTKTNTIYI